MNTKAIKLQKTSNQESDFIIVEAIDEDENFLFDVSYNSELNRFEVLFGKDLDKNMLEYDNLMSKLAEAKKMVEDDVKSNSNPD